MALSSNVLRPRRRRHHHPRIVESEPSQGHTPPFSFPVTRTRRAPHPRLCQLLLLFQFFFDWLHVGETAIALTSRLRERGRPTRLPLPGLVARFCRFRLWRAGGKKIGGGRSACERSLAAAEGTTSPQTQQLTHRCRGAVGLSETVGVRTEEKDWLEEHSVLLNSGLFLFSHFFFFVVEGGGDVGDRAGQGSGGGGVGEMR